MTRAETLKILTVLGAAYPQMAQRAGEAAMGDIVCLWSMQFADYDYAEVARAVNSIIATRLESYAPSIGLIKESIAKEKLKSIPDPDEAWLRLRKALRSCTYKSAEEFSKLPRLTREAVGCPAQLRSWAMQEESETDTRVRRQFLSSYKSLLNRYMTEMINDPAVLPDLTALAAPRMEPEKMAAGKFGDYLPIHDARVKKLLEATGLLSGPSAG